MDKRDFKKTCRLLFRTEKLKYGLMETSSVFTAEMLELHRTHSS